MMTFLDHLKNGNIAIEFNPKYHELMEMFEVLQRAFPDDKTYDYEGFKESFDPQDPQTPVYFEAWTDDSELKAPFNEWTWCAETKKLDSGIIIVNLNDYRDDLTGLRIEETVFNFLEKYG
jgi:hypothetical protein